MKLDVYFVRENDIGTAYIIENLIADEIQLNLSSRLFIHETKRLIDKAVKLLEKRYGKINVDIHWNTLDREEDDDVTTIK